MGLVKSLFLYFLLLAGFCCYGNSLMDKGFFLNQNSYFNSQSIVLVPFGQWNKLPYEIKSNFVQISFEEIENAVASYKLEMGDIQSHYTETLNGNNSHTLMAEQIKKLAGAYETRDEGMKHYTSYQKAYKAGAIIDSAYINEVKFAQQTNRGMDTDIMNRTGIKIKGYKTVPLRVKNIVANDEAMIMRGMTDYIKAMKNMGIANSVNIANGESNTFFLVGVNDKKNPTKTIYHLYMSEPIGGGGGVGGSRLHQASMETAFQNHFELAKEVSIDDVQQWGQDWPWQSQDNSPVVWFIAPPSQAFDN